MFSLEAIMLPVASILYLINLAVAVSLLCGVGLVMVRICRSRSAPLQHGILVWTLLLILLSPMAVWVAQRDGLALIQISFVDTPDSQDASLASARPPAELPASNKPPISALRGEWMESESNPFPKGEQTGVSVVSERQRSFAGEAAVSSVKNAFSPSGWRVIGNVVAWLWGAGIIVGLVRLGCGYVALARFCYRLNPLLNPRWKLLVHRAADVVGLRRLPPVFTSSATGVPISIGLLRPAIVLPEALSREMDEKQLQAIIIHEAAHIARRDRWVGIGQRISAALFWWNPLVHHICGEISELREEICDNHVVLVQGEGHGLAKILIDLAARATIEPLLPSTVGVLEPKLAGLTGRVTRLLKMERNMETRMNLRSKVIMFVCGLVVLSGMTTVGSMRLTFASAASENQPAATDQATPSVDTTPQAKQSSAQVAKPGDDQMSKNAADKTSDYQNLSDVRKMLAEKYPTVDQSKLNEAAIRGMLQSLNDPHADYFSSEKIADIRQFWGGTHVGIGAVLRKDKDHIMVTKTLPHSPAESAGLEPDTELLRIDGHEVSADFDEVVKLIRGTPNTVVKIKARKMDGTVVDLSITRVQITIPCVYGLWQDGKKQWQYWLDSDRKLGYVRIGSIDGTTVKQTINVIEQLKQQGLKGLVLDLRDLPGGLLSATTEFVGLFQKDGRLLTIKKHDGEEKCDADGKNWMGDFPLVVLINGKTVVCGRGHSWCSSSSRPSRLSRRSDVW